MSFESMNMSKVLRIPDTNKFILPTASLKNFTSTIISELFVLFELTKGEAGRWSDFLYSMYVYCAIMNVNLWNFTYQKFTIRWNGNCKYMPNMTMVFIIPTFYMPTWYLSFFTANKQIPCKEKYAM